MFRLFRGFGVNLKKTYGPTELSGIVALQSGLSTTDAATGAACPGIAVRIAANGEVQVKSPGICLGYHQDTDASSGDMDDGWWRTGDAGQLGADGHLTITGRMSAIALLPDGASFSPEEIETALRGSRFIADAVVPGKDCPLVAAMIVINATAAGNWARTHDVAYTTLTELISAPALRRLIRDEVRACNATLPSPLHVRRFALLESGSAAGTEAGLSRELQRRILLQANTSLVNALLRDRNTDGACAIEDVDGEVPANKEHADA